MEDKTFWNDGIVIPPSGKGVREVGWICGRYLDIIDAFL